MGRNDCHRDIFHIHHGQAHVHTPSLWMPVIGYDSFSFASVYDCTTEWFIRKLVKQSARITSHACRCLSFRETSSEATEREHNNECNFTSYGGSMLSSLGPLSDFSPASRAHMFYFAESRIRMDHVSSNGCLNSTITLLRELAEC